MSYAAAIDQLSAMAPELHTQPGQQRRKFSLGEIGALLAALGNPHHRFRSVLIAGTNGKGSTASTLASILQSSGLRTGLYTSPHLVRPNERIRLNSLEISDDAFASLYFRVHDSGQHLVLDHTLAQMPSFFETLTAMAFLHFAEQQVDIAVLEVGMGGRLDATNIVDPLLSIVTDISLDHTEWLGPTIAAIAREKAGILRADGTLITLPQHPEANQVLGEVATELGTRAVSAVPYMPASHSGAPSAASGAATASAQSTHPSAYQIQVLGSLIQIDSPLHGDHQRRNIALAIAAAVELATRHSLPITPTSIEQGIRSTQWPGRLEVIAASWGTAERGAPGLASDRGPRRQVLVAGVVETWEGTKSEREPSQWILDVAHNPAGAWALRAALRSEFGLGETVAPATLIFSCLRDKPLAEMAQILFPLFNEIIFAPIHSPRATPVADLLAAAETVGVPARAAASVEEALVWAENAPAVANNARAASTTKGVGDFSPRNSAAYDNGALAPDPPAPAAGLEDFGPSNHASRREARPALRVVAGSVYLVGEIRPILLARAQR